MRILRSTLLEEYAGVIHGFVHDPGGPDLLKIASDHGLEDILTVDQVHGNSVFFAEHRAVEEFAKADSIVTCKKGVGIGVITADCVPILLYFPNFGCICAVHAGWRGTSLHAVRSCLEAVWKKYSLRPQDAVASIGPSIGKCCYEVRDDVASQFVSSSDVSTHWLCEKGDGKFFLDLVELNRIELFDAGVSEIETMNVCTYCQGFPSYRRDGYNADRMISFIGISP